ncbi:MAG: 4Fe-4S dicluster domain-containing protein [Candidatus Mcinerneyibacterium aminivorans]|uniref:4Fe-4S dicluster domain-containing protein n=1 Tax=Candidatus Mcinerneyibacterium aminivorans TaxID=2703815 RepID=A0A5D0MGJ3_9BACT|nr:MAG: 4Fe-4S dicluster domain-containing protein [Candidatus Mcinerneyibacterium aminivorans]
MKREIVKIDREKCNGCGECIPNCPEGALQIIDGKATLVSDLYCDGLGACIGECPKNAITIEKREAEEYDEKKVMKNIVKKGENVIKAHLKHLKDHNEKKLYKEALNYLKEKDIENPLKDTGSKKNVGKFVCPGAAQKTIEKSEDKKEKNRNTDLSSQLGQWPVQLHLLNPNASYLENADLLISADCVPYAYANFHQRFMKDKIVITLCPKLDKGIDLYIEKLKQIFKNKNISSVTVLNMEVPCCSNTLKIVEKALKKAGEIVIIKNYTITIKGEIV